MTIAKKDIDRDVAKLSAHEQARIAADIITRLHGTHCDTVNDWADEALQRYADIKAGAEKTFDSAEVLGEARSRLRKR